MSPLRLTPEHIELAREVAGARRITRTKAGPHDGMVGAIGEIAFAERYFGNPRIKTVKGKADFFGMEVKCSQIPLRAARHLLVRQDYALARAAPIYVQLIIDKEGRAPVEPGDVVRFLGWSTHTVLLREGILRDWGSKLGGKGGYLAYGLPVTRLIAMRELPEWIT